MDKGVLCFTWNADGLRLCNAVSETDATEQKRNFFGKIKRAIGINKNCVVPDFTGFIINGIRDASDIILAAVTTQGEDKSNSYFHSDVLPAAMKAIDFVLLRREKIDGVGDFASHVKYPNDIESGKPSGSSLQLSIYAINKSIPNIREGDKKVREIIGGLNKKITYTIDSVKAGAIFSYVNTHESDDIIVFGAIDCSTDPSINDVVDEKTYLRFHSRNRAKSILCLSKFLDEGIGNSRKIDNILNVRFIMGDPSIDLLYEPGDESRNRETIGNSTKASKLDTVVSVINDLGYIFDEGVENEDISMLPTWRLLRTRDKDDVNYGSNPLSIGYRDRIFYSGADCLVYGKVQSDTISKSQHNAMMGVYNIT